MRRGMEVTQLKQELARRPAAKRDFKIPRGRLAMVQDPQDNGALKLEMQLHGDRLLWAVRPRFHRQLASALQIPKPYFDRMAENQPQLVCQNVNTWLGADPHHMQMVRAIDGEVRAFLGEGFPVQVMDNDVVGETVLTFLEPLQQHGLQIKSAQITEENIYIQAVMPWMKGTLAPPDNVWYHVKPQADQLQAGLIVSNNEVGEGSFRVEQLIYRLICANGLVRGVGMKRRHVGRRGGAADENYEVYSGPTRRLDAAAFIGKVGDVLKAAVDETRFLATVQDLQRAAGDAIDEQRDVVEAVEVTAQTIGLTQAEKDQVQSNFIKEGDFSRWGLANAVTATANDETLGYDRSVELERMGGQIIDLDPRQWKAIASVQ